MRTGNRAALNMTTDQAKEPSDTTVCLRLLRLAASVRLYVYLSVIIALALVIGTLLPQGESVAGSASVVPQAAAIYYSWWFAALFVLLALNILGCTVERLISRCYRLGSVIAHLGMVITLIGGALSALIAERGSLELSVGQSTDSFVSDENHPLGFSLRLDDFAVDFAPSSPGKLSFCTADDQCRSYPVELGKAIAIEQCRCTITVSKSFLDLRIDTETKQPVDVSDQPNNPALLVEITDASKTTKSWLFARYPEMNIHNVIDGQLRMSYQYSGAAAHIADFRSVVSIIDRGNTVATKTIRVNDPLRYKGYSFYQARYNPLDLHWTGLSVVRDPAITIVYIGFCLLVTGLLLAFYTSK